MNTISRNEKTFYDFEILDIIEQMFYYISRGK